VTEQPLRIFPAVAACHVLREKGAGKTIHLGLRHPATAATRKRAKAFTAVVSTTAFLLAAIFTAAQTNVIPSRITQAIDVTHLTTLHGNTHPLAQPQFDRGAAPSSLPMQRMMLVLRRSAQQESALDALLEEQLDAASPNYHRWLTPQEFGREFGPSDQDIQTIASWLQSQGFQVDRVSNGRTVIEFSGTSGEVQSAFRTTIHEYDVNGQNHWANSSDPEIPSALSPVVAGIDSLNNFPRQPQHELGGSVFRNRQTGQIEPAQPLFTLGGQCGVPPLACYGVGPYDFATIYNVLPLWNLSPAPTDGTGVTIAIVGQSDINIQDVRDFRSYFGLPANDPQIIVDGPDPGYVPDDETESDLDVEWSGAVAKGAAIDFVTSATTEASLGVDLSAEYAIDNNLAPILSESYGLCELFLGNAGNMFYNQLWQQAAAQGITVLVSTGDSGSAVCDRSTGSRGAAQFGLSVSGISSTPYNVAVGGTDFNDLTNVNNYWGANAPPPGQPGVPATVSAKSYIPETTWNNSCTNAVFGDLLGYSSNAETNCNNQQLRSDGFVVTIGGSGGKSSCITSGGQNPSSCTQGYVKPSWQTALTPHDGQRDVPDVSLFAAAGSPAGAFYIICEADQVAGYTSCNPSDANTHFVAIGGTSASTPAFAGIMALVNQATGSRQGNANYDLYKLAAQSGATCNSSNGAGTGCAFYDVTNGTIEMPCVKGSPNCNVSNQADSVGVLSGYNSTSGYDLATGLGSVNAANLVSAWKSFALALESSATTLTLTPPTGGSLSNLTHGQTVSFNVNVGAVAPATGTPTGAVALVADTGTNGQAAVQSVPLNGSGGGSGTTNVLPGGTYTVEAQYPGDGTFGSSASSPPISVTVAKEASKTTPAVVTFNPKTGQVTNPNAATFTYGSSYFVRSNVTNSSGSSCFNSASGAFSYDCPTGTINLTDNSAALGPGSFLLNTNGYAEFDTSLLTGGPHNLSVSYGGDASYNASSGTDAVTVTTAPTTTTISSPAPSVPAQNVIIGQPLTVSVQTLSSSLGAIPDGTFTVFDGTNQLTGIVSTSGFTTPSSDQVTLNGNIQTKVSGPSGPHSLTAHYSGDTNYAASVSGGVTFNALYPDTMTLSANPNNVILGNSVTLTATLDTTNPASNATLKPTGAITFNSSSGAITGTVTTTTSQDSSGNWMEQATVTTTPQQTESVTASFAGDSNYEQADFGLTVIVTIPDFSVSANPTTLPIVAGQTGMATLTITPATKNTSTVNLTCPAVSFWGGTCTISPTSVTLMNGAPETATVSLGSVAPSSNLTAIAFPARLGKGPQLPTDRGVLWALGGAAGLASLLLFSLPGRRRSPIAAMGLAFVALLSFTVGCGGGSGNQGGGGPSLSSTAITASATKIAQNAALTLSATVTSTGTPSGSVNFTSTCNYSESATLANGTAQIQVPANGIGVGTCAFTAQYNGDASHSASKSGSLDVAFTGTTSVTVLAQTSTDTHPIQVNVTLQ
jgi:Pro-kumamolisin, activation domain/Bacterial Ig-like domain (group 3)